MVLGVAGSNPVLRPKFRACSSVGSECYRDMVEVISSILVRPTRKGKSLRQEIECSKCSHEFEAKLWVNGHCPRCGKRFIWDSACEGTENEYYFPDWEPDFGPEYVDL